MSDTDGIPAATTSPLQAEGNSVTQTWRLVKWYLFTTRRRLMSKILLGLLVGFFVISVGFNLLGFFLFTVAENGGSVQCTPVAVSTSQTGSPSPNSSPSCQDLQQQQQQAALTAKSVVDQVGRSLTFPYSLSIAGGYLGSMGIILFCIMAAALVGSEYSSGTLRLTLSRGTRRGQLIAAQVSALAILSLAVAGLILVLAAIVGATIGPLIGGSLPTFSPATGIELLAYWLANSLGVFAFGLIAFFMSTLSRNVIAGIGVSLGYLILESVVGNILYYAGSSMQSSLGNFLQHIPDYLVGYNTGALAHLAAVSPISLYSSLPTQTASGTVVTSNGLPGPGSGIDTLHALIIILVYCLLFGGLSYLFLRRRDVTE